MKRWIFGLLVLAAVLAGTATLLLTPKLQSSLVVFPDGEAVVLRRVTYGTNHLAPKPEGWPLPWIVRSWFYPPPTSSEFHDTVTAEPSLVLWLESALSERPGAPARGSTWVMLADAAGNAAGKRVRYFSNPAARRSRLIFTNWPETSRKLTIRWFKEEMANNGEAEGKLTGEWTIANPAYRAPKLWEPEALPVSRTNGGVRCTLERVLFGLRANAERIPDPLGIIRRYDLSRPGEETGVVLMPRFDQDSGDVSAAKWEVGSVVITDSAGNKVVREPFWIRVSETCCSFAPALWPEHPWELRIFAKRRVPSKFPTPPDFSADELMTFRNVSLDGPGETLLDQELEHGGAKLKLRRFILRAPKPTDQPWQSEEVSGLAATFIRKEEGLAIDIAGLLDDQGLAHYPRARGFATRGGSASLELTYSFPTLPLKTASLTFIFVVQDCREFTFHVSPEIATSPLSVRETRSASAGSED